MIDEKAPEEAKAEFVKPDYTPILLPHTGRRDAGDARGVPRRGRLRGLEQGAPEMKPEEVVEEVKASGLRGRGGAGFPAG